MDTPLVNVDGSRNAEQRALMEKMEREGICPFCPGNFPNDILYENEWWMLSHNLWPRENARLQLLAVCKLHLVSLDELAATPAISAQLMDCFAWASSTFAVEGGILLLRFGDFASSGASIAHMHAHMIVPDDPSKYKISLKIRER